MNNKKDKAQKPTGKGASTGFSLNDRDGLEPTWLPPDGNTRPYFKVLEELTNNTRLFMQLWTLEVAPHQCSLRRIQWLPTTKQLITTDEFCNSIVVLTIVPEETKESFFEKYDALLKEPWCDGGEVRYQIIQMMFKLYVLIVGGTFSNEK